MEQEEEHRRLGQIVLGGRQSQNSAFEACMIGVIVERTHGSAYGVSVGGPIIWLEQCLDTRSTVDVVGTDIWKLLLDNVPTWLEPPVVLFVSEGGGGCSSEFPAMLFTVV